VWTSTDPDKEEHRLSPPTSFTPSLQVQSVAISADGTRIVSGHAWKGLVKIWNAATGDKVSSALCTRLDTPERLDTHAREDAAARAIAFSVLRFGGVLRAFAPGFALKVVGDEDGERVCFFLFFDALFYYSRYRS